MPVRLIQPYMDQAANTLWWGVSQRDLVANGVADDRLELASDYALLTRKVTTTTANTSQNARVYRMISASAQALTVNAFGDLELGGVLTVTQEGAGKTTLTPAAGITINTAASSMLTAGQWSVVQLIKTGQTSFIAFGGLGG